MYVRARHATQDRHPKRLPNERRKNVAKRCADACHPNLACIRHVLLTMSLLWCQVVQNYYYR